MRREIVQLQIGIFYKRWFWRPSDVLLVFMVFKHVLNKNPDDATLSPLRILFTAKFKMAAMVTQFFS